MYTSSFSIAGQWLGLYEYGPEYGELYGEKVSFSLVLEDQGDGRFTGICHDLEGVGASPTSAVINGYTDGHFIHFTKEYSKHYGIEDDGTLVDVSFPVDPILTYDGEYHQRTGFFSGIWELEITRESTPQGDEIELVSGKWEMSKA